MNYREFEAKVRQFLSNEWNVELKEREVKIGEAVKRFDLVSPDQSYIGDAKFLKNIPVPAAKFSDISECIWLLQKRGHSTSSWCSETIGKFLKDTDKDGHPSFRMLLFIFSMDRNLKNLIKIRR